ncbi:winged helix-turn-helix transcriptional regulator [Methanosphaerula palustris]|uniref:Transcriptional regulator, HxlR family n=1 Tax=Methanosphaerula palustris (strain ATCC BAA-1556 / DSM 19958 / E1-9c) TaxID=521011 RepID=B8GES1_METPE|nr:helix-turn-helix domain-containing protein [Methanosphaerula palustris]ACL17772.1 transcriptional regulator, HxlR family [Methanosphaerula palustris E1-9c]
MAQQSCPYQCPVEAAFDFIGGKWKALIIWHIGKSSRRYSEIKQKLPKISPHILSRQLKMLEDNGLILRKQHEGIPPRVEYTLTAAGLGLLPILDLTCDWAIAHYPEHIPKGFFKQPPGS